MMPEDQHRGEEVLPDHDANGQNGTYAVGYGRPPVAHRFTPGEFGNRRGRPRRSQPNAAVFEEMYKSTVTIIIDGKRRRLTLRQVVALRAKKEILTGNPRTIERWMAYSDKVEPHRSESAQQQIDVNSLTDEQLTVLASIRIGGDPAE
jgi:hypothetical protein